MKQEESYIRDTRDFLVKPKAAGEVPKGAIFSDTRCCRDLSQYST